MDMNAQDAFEMNFFENVLKRDRQNRAALELLGGLYSKYEMARQALRIDRRLVRLAPDDPRACYNLACSLCLLGRKRDAIAALKEAIDRGYDDIEWLSQDTDFDNLKDHPEFKAIIQSGIERP